MRLRALFVLTILIQSRLGPNEFGLVTISTTSPVLSLAVSGTIRPLTLAPTVFSPTWV